MTKAKRHSYLWAEGQNKEASVSSQKSLLNKRLVVLLSEEFPTQPCISCWHWSMTRSISTPLNLKADVTSPSMKKSSVIFLLKLNLPPGLSYAITMQNSGLNCTMWIWQVTKSQNCGINRLFFQLNTEIDKVIDWTKTLQVCVMCLFCKAGKGGLGLLWEAGCQMFQVP